MAVADDVFNGVLCAVLFPRDVLDEIWDFIESVSEGFPTYSTSTITCNLEEPQQKYRLGTVSNRLLGEGA